jgi:hypothetical protein
MQTLMQFIEGTDVAMHSRQVTHEYEHPPVIVEPWAAYHYACELRRSDGDRPVTTIIGSDDGSPDLSEVLDAVAAEAAVVDEAGSYEQWAERMGFNPDSRSGERVYRAARRRARMLRGLLGEERYRQLLWDTERL